MRISLGPSVPYFNPTNAWLFIALVHRLSTTPDNTLTFKPQIKSPTTVRIKFFNGRKYALDKSDEQFVYYRPLLNETSIRSSAAEKSVTLVGTDEFEYQYKQLIGLNRPFDAACRSIIAFLSATQPAIQINTSLNSDQQSAIDDFCRMFPAIGQVIVQPATVILRLR